MDGRRREWKDLLTANLVDREVIPGGVRLRFQPSTGTIAEVNRLIELERDCCSWIDWSITGGRLVEVEATAGNRQGADLLAEWFGLSTDSLG